MPNDLIVAAEEWVPYVIVHKDGDKVRFSGVMMEVLDHLSRSMKFNFTMVRPPDGKWGIQESDGSWNGMIGMLHRKEVDLGLGPFGTTHGRSKVCDFSVPLFVDETSILMAAPEIQADPFVMLKPFDSVTWAGLIICLLGVILTFVMMDRMFSGRERSLVVGFTIRVLFSEPPSRIPESWDHQRILAICWLFSLLVLSQSYSGTLVSLFAVPSFHVPINSLEDLIAQESLPWAIESGTVMESFTRNSVKGSHLRTIYDGTKLIKNCRANKDQIKKGQLAAFCVMSDITAISSQDFSETGSCNFVFAQETLLPLNLALTMQKNSPLLSDINRHLLVLVETGFVSQSVSRHVSNSTQCHSRTAVKASKIAQQSTPSLQLSELVAIFVLAGFCFLTALGIFAVEVSSKKGAATHSNSRLEERVKVSPD